MSVHLESKLLSCNFSQKTNKQICFSILTTQKYLKLEIQFQVSSIKQILPFVFWEKLQLNNFVLRSTDL